MAIVVQLDQTRTVLLTAAGGGAWAVPEQLASSEAAVAVGAGGRVVVAYYDWQRRGVYVRTGRAGSAIGAERLLSARRTPAQDIVTAIDGAGNATIAFTSDDPHDRYRRAALVATRWRPDGRFGPLVGASPAAVPRSSAPALGACRSRPPARQPPCCGMPTRPIFQNRDDGRLRVAIARDAGRFARPQSPSSPAAGNTIPFMPAVAVNDAGDVLLTYAYANAVHASQRSGGNPRFGAPHVISTLGSGRVGSGALQGATPVAALLSDHRPLIVYNNLQGAQVVASSLSGPRPDLTAPQATVKLPRPAPLPNCWPLTRSAQRSAARKPASCTLARHYAPTRAEPGSLPTAATSCVVATPSPSTSRLTRPGRPGAPAPTRVSPSP